MGNPDAEKELAFQCLKETLERCEIDVPLGEEMDNILAGSIEAIQNMGGVENMVTT